MAFIDFEKAFDKIDWQFIDKCLESYNFGPNVRRRINVFYNDIESCVINNGFSSRYFKIKNGARQCNPLPALLFIIGVEI